MKITETKLKGCLILEPQFFEDNRGIFFEVFKKKELCDFLGYEVDFVQENKSISKKGVLRGLHFQTGTAAQAKLVSVQKGEVDDVIVDIRPDSESFGKYIKINLSDINNKSIFIPKGMAHGFVALSNNVIFTYLCDNYYNPSMESGILYNDADLAIDWGYSGKELTVSEKDLILPSFKELLK
ncbi:MULTISPECIES: dTDP-4-dehydrorhamnose 3,5-epimerase [unclassified Maribacter]|uniref:dTDP-4-dehydrorhamnose 3,5-epimerase n=2 Tax=Maribacter TaxID=252356 RepID=UPI00257E2431|nr:MULTISPECIES: dTDP-4-dehydrorhamnose 3,5-epimerase [unclassified Maribacter]|tara:strand:+ start:26 stop:571 length:546 start_codon:yes stop_codon:yes gene_type:complete